MPENRRKNIIKKTLLFVERKKKHLRIEWTGRFTNKRQSKMRTNKRHDPTAFRNYFKRKSHTWTKGKKCFKHLR